MDILEDWPNHEAALRSLDPREGDVVSDAKLIAPITYPRKLLCAGANYYAHAAEMGTAAPSPDATPFFFLKPPTTTIVGDQATVAYPSSERDPCLDWEAELAVVIARSVRAVDLEHALDYVAGYTAANDLSARGLFPRPDAVMAPFAFDWLLQKAQDGSCPLGPAIVPAWFVENPQSLNISLAVNGVIKQDSNTADMVATVSQLVSAASHLLTLEAGDVILTGTPAGVGLPRGEYLHPGDRIDVCIETLGLLTTHIGPSRN
jgi:2-keto-4-pentenoate hydratase/2-oxohepta-3-ene-1,7-dioic acid hydratase in catechol pathway